MRVRGQRTTAENTEAGRVGGRVRSPDERQVEIDMFRVLLTSLKKRYTWDRIKCAIATGIPAFWIVMLVLRPHLSAVLLTSVPSWLAAPAQPLLEDIPAIWTIAISLAVAGFQWRNLAHFQHRVIPLVREMYERAQTRRDPELLTMLADALRLRTLRESLRTALRRLFSLSQ